MGCDCRASAASVSLSSVRSSDCFGQLALHQPDPRVWGWGLLLYQFPWLHLSLWPGAGVDWGSGMLLESWQEFPW